MAGFQDEKRVVLDYYAALDAVPLRGIASVLSAHTAAAYTWRGYHPFHMQTDVQQVADLFWIPFRRAVTQMQRRMDVFFAGQNFMDGQTSTWVCSMGSAKCL